MKIKKEYRSALSPRLHIGQMEHAMEREKAYVQWRYWQEVGEPPQATRVVYDNESDLFLISAVGIIDDGRPEPEEDET